MKAISPPPNGQRPVSVRPRISLYHASERSRSVTWIPTCPTRLIVNPFTILPSSLWRLLPANHPTPRCDTSPGLDLILPLQSKLFDDRFHTLPDRLHGGAEILTVGVSGD